MLHIAFRILHLTFAFCILHLHFVCFRPRRSSCTLAPPSWVGVPLPSGEVGTLTWEGRLRAMLEAPGFGTGDRHM